MIEIQYWLGTGTKCLLNAFLYYWYWKKFTIVVWYGCVDFYQCTKLFKISFIWPFLPIFSHNNLWHRIKNGLISSIPHWQTRGSNVPDTVGLFAALSSYNIAILYSAVLWQPVLAVDEVRVSMGTILLMANVKHTIVVISNNYILSKYFYSLTPIFMVSTKCIDPWILEFIDPWIL